jgi:uncharacterized protein (DUF302 family)
MKKILILISFMLFATSSAIASDGLVVTKSVHSVKDTADKLVGMLEKKGMTVFIRIDHAAGAKKVDKVLRPTEVVIFGNPKAGTPVMQCSQKAAIDFPQKALIMEDENGEVTLSYNDPFYIAKRHNIQGCEKVLTKISGILANFAKGATSK